MEERRYSQSEMPITGDTVRWSPRFIETHTIEDGGAITAIRGDTGVIENIDMTFAPMVTVRFHNSRRSWDVHPGSLFLIKRGDE